MSEQMKVYGKISRILDLQQISASFKKQEVILITEGDYPQPLKFEFTQDNCSKTKDLKVGQFATIYFNLRGRDYIPKDKQDPVYFVSLNAWKVETAVMGGEEKHVSEQMNEQFNSQLPF